MSRRLFLAGSLAPFLVWTADVRAQIGAHGHAHSGNEVKIGHHEVELVVRGGEAALLVRDERGQLVDAASFGATAAVLARANKRRTLEFRPADANRLVTPVDFSFDGKFWATVTLRGPAGELGTGRFNVDLVR